MDEPQRDIAEELVSGVMSESVVDFLEPVEVDEQHGNALAVLARVDSARDVVVQRDAVRQAGERIVTRLVVDLRNVLAQLPRRARESGQEQDEEEHEGQLEDAGDGEQ